MGSKTMTVGLLGCGQLGQLVAQGIAGGRVAGYRLVGATDQNPSLAGVLSEETTCPLCPALEDLLAKKPDFVVEAAGIEALKSAAVPILAGGSNLIPLSIGAFADETFLAEVCRAAEEHGTKVYLPSGAIGGFDLMRGAKLQGNLRVSMDNEKPPRALQDAVEDPLPQARDQVLFSGTAREAITRFPKNVNVAVAAALATNGPGETMISVVSRPELTAPRHTIRLEGDFGRATIQIEPMVGANQRSSTLAAYSVLALLERLNSVIVF